MIGGKRYAAQIEGAVTVDLQEEPVPILSFTAVSSVLRQRLLLTSSCELLSNMRSGSKDKPGPKSLWKPSALCWGSLPEIFLF